MSIYKSYEMQCGGDVLWYVSPDKFGWGHMALHYIAFVVLLNSLAKPIKFPLHQHLFYFVPFIQSSLKKIIRTNCDMVLALAEIFTPFITTLRNKAAHGICEISEDSMIMRSHMSCPIWYCAFGFYCPLVFHIISISFSTCWWCDSILLLLLFWIKEYFYVLLNIRW